MTMPLVIMGWIISGPVDFLSLTLVNALSVSSTEIVYWAILVDGCYEVKIRWPSVVRGMSLVIELKSVEVKLVCLCSKLQYASSNHFQVPEWPKMTLKQHALNVPNMYVTLSSNVKISMIECNIPISRKVNF